MEPLYIEATIGESFGCFGPYRGVDLSQGGRLSEVVIKRGSIVVTSSSLCKQETHCKAQSTCTGSGHSFEFLCRYQISNYIYIIMTYGQILVIIIHLLSHCYNSAWLHTLSDVLLTQPKNALYYFNLLIYSIYSLHVIYYTITSGWNYWNILF